MKTRAYGEKLISDLKSAPKNPPESVKKSNARSAFYNFHNFLKTDKNHQIFCGY